MRSTKLLLIHLPVVKVHASCNNILAAEFELVTSYWV